MANKTVYVDGTTSSGHYASLQAAITGEVSANPNLTAAGMNGILNIEISMTTADTTAVCITGFTTDATHYVNIYTTAAARHSGVYSTSKYRIEPASGAYYSIEILAVNFVTIDGIQTYYLNPGAASYYDCISFHGCSSSAAKFTFKNNIIKGASGVAGALEFIGAEIWDCGAGSVMNAYNNIIYGFTGGTADYIGLTVWDSDCTLYAYNNTICGCKSGLKAYEGTLVAKNNICYNNTVDYEGTFHSSSTNNLASDTTTPEYNTYYDSKTLTFMGTGDYRLCSSDTDAIDHGADLHEDANCSFTTDIVGTTRSGTWDIGAFEYIASGINTGFFSLM